MKGVNSINKKNMSSSDIDKCIDEILNKILSKGTMWQRVTRRICGWIK